MEQSTGGKVLIRFGSRSTGRQSVTGPVTKTPYGYRKAGDTFEVFEADMHVRPDLFRPIGKQPEQAPVVQKRSEQVRQPSEGLPVQETVTPGRAGAMQPQTLPPPPKHLNPKAKHFPATEEETDEFGFPGTLEEWDGVPEHEHVHEVDFLERREELNKLDLPLEDLDWSGTRINKGHIKILKENGITSLRALQTKNEAEVLKIDGIGPATVRGLFELFNRYNIS